MSPLNLPSDFLGWLQLLVAVPVLLSPGFFLAHRFSSTTTAVLLSPILTFSSITPLAILLNRWAGLPVTLGSTLGLCFVVAVLAAWPLLRRQTMLSMPTKAHWRFLGWCLPALLFVGLIQGMPHLDPEPAHGAQAWVEITEQAWSGISGDHEPAPVHVDANLFAAKGAYVARTGDATPVDPYTGTPSGTDFFSVSGMRSEQGFAVALGQLELLTGLSVPALMRFLPATWAMYQGLLLASLAHGRAGAAAIPLAVAFIPNTGRLLGAGYAVPSAFATAWIWGALLVLQNRPSPARYLGLMLVITGGFFQHLVPATIAYVAVAMHAVWLRQPGLGGRLGALLVPLTWIMPSVALDASLAVRELSDLPFAFEPILRLWPALVLGLPFVAWAFYRRDALSLTLASVAGATLLSMMVSVAIGHSNEATYTRIMYAAIASTAATGILGLFEISRRWTHGKWRPALNSILLVLVLSPVAVNATDSVPYRIHPGHDLDDLEVFAAAKPTGVFLAHPWRAPLLNAVTGATPAVVMFPGTVPEYQWLWDEYMETGGSTQLFDRFDLDYVIGPVVPNAPHELIGADVYRLT